MRSFLSLRRFLISIASVVACALIAVFVPLPAAQNSGAAAQNLLIATQNLPASGACYLPTESNVSYASILELPTDSPDEVINYAEGDLQFGELWLPKNRFANKELKDLIGESIGPESAKLIGEQQQSPLVIMVHGGCWLNSFDISHTHAFSSALKQAGYAVWSIEYRRTGDPGGGWPGSYEDIIKAIKFVSNLGGYGIDLKKIALTGHSAGGHLALLAASDPVVQSSVDIQTIIGLAAITDLASYAQGDNSCETATPLFMGGAFNKANSEIAKEYIKASVRAEITPANTVLLHGSADAIVPQEQSTNSNLTYEIIEGAGHFDFIHPGTSAFKALLKKLGGAL